MAEDRQNGYFGWISAAPCWHDSASNCGVVGRRGTRPRSACVLALQPTRSASGRSSVLVVSVVFLGLVFMPPLFGKAILQVSTIADSTGFALLPRVSLLPVSRVLGERSPDWIAMSSSWRTAATQLDAIGLTQFDAQLQEAIRFDLGPKVLLPAILNRSSEEIAEKCDERNILR